MNIKSTVIGLLTICVIALLPHANIIPMFGYVIPITLLVWFALKQSAETFSDIGFRLKSFKPKVVLVASFVAVTVLAFMQLAFFPVLNQFVTFEETDAEIYEFITRSKWHLMFMISMGWIVGGLYEEIVFHGFIFTRLEKMLKGKFAFALSFFFTALIFGLYHLQLGLDGALNALVIGAVYQGVMLCFKRNLWYSIVTHGMYNTLVMLLIYFEIL
jgi:membrane protease YdiL (CAAX protease family)